MRFSSKTISWKTIIQSIQRAPMCAWWTVFLFGFAIITLLFLVFGIYIFARVSKETFIEKSPISKSAIEPIDREKFTKIVDYFNQKKINFEYLKINPPQTNDPSI